MDIIKLWKGSEHHEHFSNDMIMCPLEEDELMASYKVDPSIHPTYNEQLEEMRAKLKNPPTNINLPKSLTPMQKRIKLSSKEVSWGCVWAWIVVHWGRWHAMLIPHMNATCKLGAQLTHNAMFSFRDKPLKQGPSHSTNLWGFAPTTSTWRQAWIMCLILVW